MKRLLLALPLILVLSGCIGGGKIKLPTPPVDPGHTFSGNPTDVVVVVDREGVEPSGLVTLQDNEEPLNLTVTVAKGSIYRVHRTVEIVPSEPETAVSMQVASDTAYEISAVVHSNGRMYEVGRVTGINAPDEGETIVPVEVGEPHYNLIKPEHMYSGGNLNQFLVQIHEPINEILYAAPIFFGLSEWASEAEFYALFDANPSQGWLGYSGTFLPEVEEPTKLYYQVKLCSMPGYFGAESPCFYFPAMGESLPHIMILPSP